MIKKILIILFFMLFIINIIFIFPSKSYGDFGTKWGEIYENGTGKQVCICDDNVSECAPCAKI